MIAWTGWQDRWGTPAYANEDAEGNTHQPGFSLAATRWLLRGRDLGALGTDTFGPDPGTDTEYRETSLVLHGHRMTLENLAGLEQMPRPGGCWSSAAPATAPAPAPRPPSWAWCPRSEEEPP
jgi:kynurenine formamidase